MEALNDLVDALIATDSFPTSWAYYPDGDEGAYLDCSAVASDDGTYRLEVGDDDGNVAQLDLNLSQLREIHRKLTLQLAVAVRQNA